MIDDTNWLTLGKAADRLGVHPNTLRRWSDQGRLPFMLTMGGHRRFALSQIESMLAQQQLQPDIREVGARWIESTLIQMRSELVANESEAWVNEFDAKGRLEKRVLGRRMMTLILQFVSSSDCDEIILTEARVIGAEYAASARSAGMSAVTALSAILFFRDTLTVMVFDLSENAHVSRQEQRRILGRMSNLLNKVELAIVETYDADAR